MKKKKSIIIAVSAASLLCLAIAVYSAILPKKTSVDFFSMNTYITVSAEGKDSPAACEEIQKLVNNLDSGVLSRQSEESEISAINSGCGKMSEGMRRYISDMLGIYEASEGAFDFALGSVSDLWGFGNEPHLPADAEIKAALKKSGAGKISINGDEIAANGAVIDFGAAGKGIALDEIKSLLNSMKIKNAVVSVGGSILLYGEKDFTVGIRNPEGSPGSYIMTVSTPAAFVSTSGSYEQNFEENGKIYHHILNPETGYPVQNGLVSVTVVSDNGLASDALSTACFVLGAEKGMKFAEKYGCEVIFVDSDKKVTVSDGIKDSVKLTDNSYSFAE